MLIVKEMSKKLLTHYNAFVNKVKGYSISTSIIWNY